MLKDIAEARFRANPRYELVLFDALPHEQQELLRDLQKDPDFYGILRPHEPSGLEVKSVGRDTALLYFTLQQPARLPAYVKAMLGEECVPVIAELVLDGVLEIESEGSFVSGSEAYTALYAERAAPIATGAVARLSLEALQYAQSLDMDDVHALANRLYFYHRVPVSPRWKQRFPTTDAVAGYLGIQAGGPNRPILDQAWTPVTHAPPNNVWFTWRSRHARSVLDGAGGIYKLYVSPDCRALQEVFSITLQVLTALRVPSFKIGNDVYGLLRPDKIVAYFTDLESLHQTAERLRNDLEGMPAHGVPFTAEICGDGLLSWGIDPPRQEQSFAWQGPASWRQWLANRLATDLLAAKASPTRTVEPWQFALDRLRLQGVDTDTWTPTQTIWREDAVVER